MSTRKTVSAIEGVDVEVFAVVVGVDSDEPEEPHPAVVTARAAAAIQNLTRPRFLDCGRTPARPYP